MAQKMKKWGADYSRKSLKGRLLDDLDFSNSRFVQTHMQQIVLRDSWVNTANLQEAQLQDADLRRATFIGSDLREANLDGARMEDVDASRANFGDASLVNVSLVSACLRYCDFSGADFTGADLTSADLKFAFGYTAEQLSAARSLYAATGIAPPIEAELRLSYPNLFDVPAGWEQSKGRAAPKSAPRRWTLQTLASFFTRPKHKEQSL